jgi:NADPH:quinone reductase
VKALRFTRYGPPAVLSVEEIAAPKPGSGEALVRIEAAAINPSDVKNVAGVFTTPLPRTPGRDYAGIVVDGEGVGRRVWGSGAGFGIERDGSHAELVALPFDWLSDKPERLSMEQASAIGVPFIAAWEGLNEAELKAGATVLVTGALGAVGRAVAQIAHWKGARVIGTDIVDGPSQADHFLIASAPDLVAQVRAAAGGEGVDVAFDAVGGPMFEPSLKSLRVGGNRSPSRALASGTFRST